MMAQTVFLALSYFDTERSMMENPYVRLRNLCSISQKDFAAKYQMSKTTMVYVETGQYPDLSEKMIMSLGQETVEKGVPARQILESEYGMATLQDAYHSYQRLSRREVKDTFNIEPPQIWNKTTSPFASYIKATTGGSVQKFCKMLKVPSASVLRYRNGQTKPMPVSLEEAFTQIGFPYMRQLVESQAAWVEAHT